MNEWLNTRLLRGLIAWMPHWSVAVWIGIGVVIVLSVGWRLNIWQVTGFKDKFPYLEISKPLPEIQTILPPSGMAGDEITIKGARFEAFDPKASKILIGSEVAENPYWSRHRGEIRFTIPKGLIPGDYPVNVQIGDRQSAQDITLRVELLPRHVAQAVASGERFLLLVARIERDEQGNPLQMDLLSQIERVVEDDEKLRGKLSVAVWPGTFPFSGVNPYDKPRAVATTQAAHLVLFGQRTTGNNFYPRLAVGPRAEKMFRKPGESLQLQDITSLQIGQPGYNLSAISITKPVRLMRFLLGWYQHQTGDYAAARANFLRGLQDQDLGLIDEAVLHFTAGDTSFKLGSEILERPYRSDADHEEGRRLLREAQAHLLTAADAYGKPGGDKTAQARTYNVLGHSTFEMPFMDTATKHHEALGYYQKAAELLDCAENPDDCIISYMNMGMSYEWLASVQATRRKRDDLLASSLEATQRAAPLIEKKGGDIGATEQYLLKNDIGTILGQYYRGDRDDNLERALELSKEALAFFEMRPNDFLQKIVLTSNHIGKCYINLARGDRTENLQKAKAALERVAGLVGPDRYPEYHENLIQPNIVLAEALLAKGSPLPEYEVQARFDAEIDALVDRGDVAQAEARSWALLQWAWARIGMPNIYLAADAHHRIGQFAEAQGELEGAKSHYYAALAILNIPPSLTAPWQELKKMITSDLLRVMQRLVIDQDVMQQTLKRTEMAVTVAQQFYVVASRMSSVDPDAALKAYNQALELFPYHPQALVNRSALKMSQGDLDGVLIDLSNALLLTPRDEKALFNRAQIFMAGGDPYLDKAMSDLTEALAINPEEVQFYESRAQCYERLGKLAEAIEDWRFVVTKTSDSTIQSIAQANIERLSTQIKERQGH
jgi:tetratricopeptide (TPR) repeat protein